MPLIEAADRTSTRSRIPTAICHSRHRGPILPQRNRTRRRLDTQFVTTPGRRRRNTIDNALFA
jgi:hypothetical protein